MQPQDRKRSIVVAGNCQASFLFRALSQSPELADAYRVVYCRHLRKGDEGRIKRKDVLRCAVLIEQIAHDVGDLPFRDELPGDCRTIRFPILWMNSLWPTLARDVRAGPSAPFNGGVYPYGDQLILDLLDQGLSPEAAGRRWLQTDLREVLDLDRFHEINAEKYRLLDARADLKFGADVLAGFARSRLFLTYDHPSLGLLDHVRRAVFDALGFAAPGSDLAAISGGMDDIHAPVHPSVAEHLGLAWFEPAMSWRYLDRRFGAEEFMRRYAAMDFGRSGEASRRLQPAL